MKKLRIAVFGSGAVGSILGGLLAKTGLDVTLIGRPGHIGKIKKEGLFLVFPEAEFSVPVKGETELTFSPDLLIMAVKMQDLAETCRLAQPFIGSDTVILLTENGVTSREVASGLLNSDKIYSMLVLFNAQFYLDGQASAAGFRPVIIEKALLMCPLWSELNPALERWFHLSFTDNPEEALWSKLLINLTANTFEAVSGLPLSEAVESPLLREIVIKVLREALKVIKRKGFSLYSPEPMPVKSLEFLVRLPLFAGSRRLYRQFSAPQYRGRRTSTLQSLEKHRPTEIDYLNGEIVKTGNLLGIGTPFNEQVVRLVKETEKNGRFKTVEELSGFFKKIR